MKPVSCPSVSDTDKKLYVRGKVSESHISIPFIKAITAVIVKDIRLIFICTALAILSGTTLLQAEKIVTEHISLPVLPPVALCNNITVQLGPGGSVTISGSQIDGGSYDPDGTVVSMVASPNTFSCSNTGPNNVTLTVTDNEGLTATCNAIVTVRDNTPPVMICKNVTLYLDQTGSATLTVSDVNNGSSDNCPGTLILYLDRTNFGCSDIGSPVPVTLTGSDASGNTAFCTSQITILDTISPHVNVKPFTLVLDSDGTATLLPSDVDNGSFDNCGPLTLSVSPNTFNCGSVGNRIVTLTAVDPYGNSSSESVNITVESSVRIESISISDCDLAEPYTLYKAKINGPDTLYSFFWIGLEAGSKPFLSILPIPPYLVPTNTSTMITPFFNNATLPDGTYHIRLIVTDNNFGCKDTAEMAFTKAGSVFNNIASLHSEACMGSTQIYTVSRDTGIVVYNWTVENGTILTSDLDTNRIEVLWNSGGPLGVVKTTVSRTNIAGDPCVSYVIDSVTINPVPLPVFSDPVLTACSNSDYTYTLTSSFGSHIWSVTGGNIISGGSSGDSFVTVRWGPGPSGRVTVSADNSYACSGSVFVDVAVDNLSGSVISLTNISCNGGSDGKVTVAATPGTGSPPYQYSLDGGAFVPGGAFTGLTLGNHVVTIRDANFCQADVSFVVTQPPVPLSGSATVTNVACFGGTTGAVDLTVTGGTLPYTFLWSNGALTEDLTSVAAGVYSVTITDANLCTATALASVAQPAAALSGIAAVTNVACYGESTGAVDLTVTGGTFPYTFLWNNGAVTEDLINVPAGVYSVTITDANSCTTTASATVAQPSEPLSSTASVTNATCFGEATGAVDLTVTGGTPSYTFLWSNGAVTEDLSGIPAGTYTVTITDENSCSTTASATVAQPPELIPSAGNNGPICVNTPLNLYGGPDGMTSYTWTGPDAFSSSVQNPLVSANATLSMAGIYSLTVMDANGCIASTTTSVSIIDLNTITLSSGVGTDNQTICINTTLTDITYNTTIATGATFSGLPAGVSGTWAANVVTISGAPAEAGVFNYTVTLTGGCGTISANGTITVNELPVSVSVTPDANPVCEETAVTFTALPVNEGTAPVYQWQVNGINTGTNSNIHSYIPLNNDVITVILTSDAACATGNPATSDPLTMVVNSNPLLLITDPAAVCSPAAVDLTAEDVTAGSTTGLIFTYWMDAGAGIEFETPASATAGTYYIKGTDANGCYDIKPVTVTVNPVPVLTFSQTNILCGGTSTGAIDITAAGGTEPYTYAWTGAVSAPSDEDQLDLAAGLYTVIATDANNCSSAELPVTITELPTLTGSVTSQTNVSVPGGNDGSVTLEGSGGTPPYQYKINESIYQADGTFSLLTAGTYSITIQDVNLCEFSVPVTITQPGWPLSGTIVNQTDVLCFGEATGSVTVTGLEGDPPYEYSLDGGDFQPSGTFNMLIAGSYTVTVRDILLATYDVPVLITEPLAALAVTTTQVDLLCPGTSSGGASATASGGTEPYTYSWSTNPVQTGPTATGLEAGTYTVTVTDANACVTSTDVTIAEPPALTISIDQINVRCNGDANGRATANAEGGTGPYTYSWNTSPVQESATATGLARGSYTVTVTDANGCTFSTTVDITEPPTLGVTATAADALCPDSDDGEITLEITGGTEPYSVIWMDGISTQNRTDLLPGTYSVVISDANGCLVSTSVDVGFAGSYNCLLIPDIITPNNDGHNDEWIIRNIDIYPEAEVLVYSRWGKLVYRTKNLADNPWNGQYRGSGELMPTDSYHYILHLNDGSKPRSGVISLIR